MLRVIKKVIIVLLASTVNASNHTKCISLNNQQCMIQPTLINLYPDEYGHGWRYYPFAVNLDTCVGSCDDDDDDELFLWYGWPAKGV